MSKIRFVLFVFSLLSVLQPWFPAWAQSRDSSADIETMISSTIDDTYNYKFRDALKITNGMIASYPNEPEGCLYKCGVLWKMMEEGCVGSVDSTRWEIKRLIDKACELSGAEVKENPNDAKELFYYAGSLVYRARYEATKNDWLAVMSDGIEIRKLLEKAVKIDTSFFDAYSGIGAFNYYAAHIPWYLKPIALVLGINGNEEEGIEQLKKAAQFGKYSKTEAAGFLASVVYTNNQDYSDAAKSLLGLHQEYPDNLEFVRSLCSVYYKMRKYAEVIRLADPTLGDHDGFIKCHQTSIRYIRYYRGASYEMLNKKNKAIADFEMVLKLNGNDYASKQARAALDRLTSQ